MGFTVGSGGGPPPDNSVSEDKIVDQAVSEAKLSAAVVAQLGGGEEWQTVTQANNGNSLNLRLDPTGDIFALVGQVTSNSASSATEIEFNGSSGGYSYRQHFSTGTDAGSGGYFPSGVVGSGVTCYFHGVVQRKGTTIHVDLNVSLPASSLSHSIVYKAITGATAINAIKVLSNQASGIGAGSFLKAKRFL